MCPSSLPTLPEGNHDDVMAEPIGTVGALETHISQVFFTPDRVYKRLKPVDIGFVSFVDREQRLTEAEREHQLNRRISPDVHLGLADVVEDGELTDRLIVMRRLPVDRQLDRLVDDPEFDRHIVDTARLISSFHSQQDPVRGADAWMATADEVGSNWADNFAAIDPLADAVIPAAEIDRVRTRVDDYLRGRQTLFAERIANGMVCDGHGDLRAEHVFCLPDGPRVIDCLAFRDDYRVADVLLDVAFLAMDLRRLAGPQAASRFVKAYAEFTDEHHPATLAHHYVGFRAHVRAKVAAIRFRQGVVEAADEALAYHRLAAEHLDVGQVRLVLVGGGAGVGKSTVAEGLADRLGAIWLRSDEVRKMIAGVPSDRHVFDAPGTGLYSPAVSDRVYTELLDEAEGLLQRGQSVVLDATWTSDPHRREARSLAKSTAATLTELRCDVPLAVAEERIARRMAAAYQPSDATPEIARYLADRFEPWPEAARVDTSRSIAESIEAATSQVLGRYEESGTLQPARAPVRIERDLVLSWESVRFYLSGTSALR